MTANVYKIFYVELASNELSNMAVKLSSGTENS